MSYKVYSSCLKCSLLPVFLLFFQPSFSQDKFADLDYALQAHQKLLGSNVVMMLWKAGDTLVYKKELGQFNSKTSAPFGSCSKWLTAALVMQFVDEGKISLDDKVSRWLPEFEKYGKNFITIGICLSHLTGIRDEANFLDRLFQKKKSQSLEEQVNHYAAREIRTNPGTDFWYGDMGIDIAARVLEVVSKKRFEVLIKQKLFNPLAMRRSTFSTPDASAVDPANGASGTADDYIRFLAMLLNNGKVAGKQILSEESVQQLKNIHTQSMKMAFVPKTQTGQAYALGSWVAEQQDGKATVLTNPGFFGTFAMIDFCRGYAYFVLSKELQREEKADVHRVLKEEVDTYFPSQCK